jgi:putative hemolysin
VVVDEAGFDAVVVAATARLVGEGPPTTGRGLANPASVYCVERGGEVEIVDEAGGQVGYCLLPDGTRIEEWELYRSRVESGGAEDGSGA